MHAYRINFKRKQRIRALLMLEELDKLLRIRR